MKITRSQLNQLINEELEYLKERQMPTIGWGWSSWCNYGIPTEPIHGNAGGMRGPTAEYSHIQAWAKQLDDAIDYIGLDGTTDEEGIIDALKDMICAKRIGNLDVGKRVAAEYNNMTGGDLASDIRGEWSIAGVPHQIESKIDELNIENWSSEDWW